MDTQTNIGKNMEVYPQAESAPRVAVVVIGRNEGERLRVCLQSVLSMNYPLHLLEVVYVDSQSTDGSVAMARSMGVYTIVLEGPTTAARGRNAGWMAMTAPLILFLDGDTILHPDFVQTGIASLNDSGTAAVWGNRREIDTASSVYNLLFDWDWETPPGLTAYFGGDALVRRKVLEITDGYNNDLIAGEEPDLCRRMRGLGYTILHIDVPMTMHDLDMHRFRQYWRRSVRTGFAYAQISSIYARTSDPLWRDVSRRNVVRGLFWILAPMICLALSLWRHTPLPIFAFVFLGALAVARSGRGMRHKAVNWELPIAYGMHSHLQQIPILIGQARFWLSHNQRAEPRLIEYK
jgi:cellulose synthase/poly-beta-1,6-N-acetylglucosamine synthase-like glycosyltransferase